MLGDVTGFQGKDGRGHQDRFPHAHHLSLMEGFSVWFAFIQSGFWVFIIEALSVSA